MDRLCFGRHGGGAFVRADDGGKLDLCGCVGGERFGARIRASRVMCFAHLLFIETLSWRRNS